MPVGLEIGEDCPQQLRELTLPADERVYEATFSVCVKPGHALDETLPG